MAILFNNLYLRITGYSVQRRIEIIPEKREIIPAKTNKKGEVIAKETSVVLEKEKSRIRSDTLIEYSAYLDRYTRENNPPLYTAVTPLDWLKDYIPTGKDEKAVMGSLYKALAELLDAKHTEV